MNGLLTKYFSGKYITQLPQTFFLPNTYDKWNRVIKSLNMLPFETMADFINQGAFETEIPGLRDEGTDKQILPKFNKNSRVTNRSKTFKGSIDLQENIGKELIISYRLSVFNWFVLYDNFIEFHENKDSPTHLPDVSTKLLNFNNDIVGYIVYKGIRMTELSRLRLGSSDSNINSNTFELKLSYNEFKFVTGFEKTRN